MCSNNEIICSCGEILCSCNEIMCTSEEILCWCDKIRSLVTRNYVEMRRYYVHMTREFVHVMNYYVEVTIASCHQDVTKYCLHVSTYFIDSDYIHTLSTFNLTKVRPLFLLPHRGSENSLLCSVLIISTNQIVTFMRQKIFHFGSFDLLK